jgi:hypothetical protein
VIIRFLHTTVNGELKTKGTGVAGRGRAKRILDQQTQKRRKFHMTSDGK